MNIDMSGENSWVATATEKGSVWL